MKERVAVIGTGLAAYGCLSYLYETGVEDVTIFDIGKRKADGTTLEKEVPNSKDCHGSMFPYGVRDKSSPIELVSDRICSSHAEGGFTKVFSGCVLRTRDEDLANWPRESIPSKVDWESAWRYMNIKGGQDEITKEFGCIKAESTYTTHDIVGEAQIARKPGFGSVEEPLDSGIQIEALACKRRWELEKDCYVTFVERLGDELRVHFTRNSRERYKDFDKVYLGAGAINTTGIMHNSKFRESCKSYRLRSVGMYMRLWLRIKRTEQPWHGNDEIARYFVEIKKKQTFDRWCHTQINMVNRTMTDTLAAKIPVVGRLIARAVKRRIYFSLSSINSVGSPPVEVVCNNVGGRIRIEVKERGAFCKQSTKALINRAIRDQYFRLGLIGIPCSELLIDLVKGNSLGGWHFGGTLPMRDGKREDHETNVLGETEGLADVHIIDSAAFPDIPGTTISGLVFANSRRITRMAQEQDSTNSCD